MWRVWWAPTNASKWQMGFNSAFKGLMNFTVNYQEQFWTNSAVRITNIRSKFHLCEQITNLNFFQKRAYCAYSLSCRIPVLVNVKARFKPQLSRDLNTHSFYSVDKFLMYRMTPNLICDCIEGHSWQGEEGWMVLSPWGAAKWVSKWIFWVKNFGFLRPTNFKLFSQIKGNSRNDLFFF